MVGKRTTCDDKFMGTATVGERGQIVIPAEARKRHGIETGDKMLIIATPDGKGLVLFKIDEFRDRITSLLEGIQRVETEFLSETKSEGSES